MTGLSAGQVRIDALAAGRAPRRWGAWYVAEHRFVGLRAYLQTIVSTTIGNPLIYLFAMGTGLGALVSHNLGPDAVDGTSYLAFIAPALIVSNAVSVITIEFSYPIVSGFKWNPIFTAMNSAPISPGQIIDGQLIFGAMELVGASLVYFAFLLLFGAVPHLAAGVLTVGVSALAGLAFGAPVMAYSATIDEDRGQLPMLFRFVVLPLSLFSGTYFPLTSMPVYLQWIGWVSPIWHAAQLGRDLDYGAHEPDWLIAAHLAYLVALFVAGWLLARRVAARRLGS